MIVHLKHWIGRNKNRFAAQARKRKVKLLGFLFVFLRLWGRIHSWEWEKKGIMTYRVRNSVHSCLASRIINAYAMHTKCQVCTWSWTIFFNFYINVFISLLLRSPLINVFFARSHRHSTRVCLSVTEFDESALYVLGAHALSHSFTSLIYTQLSCIIN